MLTHIPNFEVSTITCNEHNERQRKICKIFVLSHPLWINGVRHMVHLWLDGKHIIDFLLMMIESFR